MAHKIVKQTSDFIMYETESEVIDGGNVRAFRCCEELIDGRWEGFVSVIGEYTADEWESMRKA